MNSALFRQIDFSHLTKKKNTGYNSGFVILDDKEFIMARVCQITGKGTVTGNKVSHSNIKTKRRFLPNLHNKRFWLESEQRFVRLRISANGLRTIDKLGIEAVVGALRANGENI